MAAKRNKGIKQESLGKVSADDLKKSIRAVRLSDLNVHECPICKAEKSWAIIEGRFVIARAHTVSADKGYYTCNALSADLVRRAECTACGFIALFRMG